MPLGSVFVEAFDVAKRAEGKLVDVDVTKIRWNVIWLASAQRNNTSQLAFKQTVTVLVLSFELVNQIVSEHTATFLNTIPLNLLFSNLCGYTNSNSYFLKGLDCD